MPAFTRRRLRDWNCKGPATGDVDLGQVHDLHTEGLGQGVQDVLFAGETALDQQLVDGTVGRGGLDLGERSPVLLAELAVLDEQIDQLHASLGCVSGVRQCKDAGRWMRAGLKCAGRALFFVFSSPELSSGRRPVGRGRAANSVTPAGGFVHRQGFCRGGWGEETRYWDGS